MLWRFNALRPRAWLVRRPQAMAAGSSLPLPYKDMLMRRMQAIQAQLQGQPTVASLPQQPSLGPAVPPFSGAAQAAPRVPMPPAMPPAVPPFGMPPAAAAPPPPYGMIPPGIQPAMPPYGGGLMPPGMMGMAPPGAWPPTAVSAPPYGGYHGAPNGADSVSRISQTSNTVRCIPPQLAWLACRRHLASHDSALQQDSSLTPCPPCCDREPRRGRARMAAQGGRGA